MGIVHNFLFLQLQVELLVLGGLQLQVALESFDLLLVFFYAGCLPNFYFLGQVDNGDPEGEKQVKRPQNLFGNHSNLQYALQHLYFKKE